ncbi:MAG: outer-membrane lipoprotein carrier protein LolA [Isosphaeraceae bacterium]
MRRVRWHVLTLAAAAFWVSQDGARAQGQSQTPAEDPMKPLLRAWEKQSARLDTLDVEIRRVDKSEAWGDEEYVGRAILQRPNLALLDFQKVEMDANNKRVVKPHERIVCTGTEIWQYSSGAKQIFIFPLERQAQKRALEEGPLPFLFNMKAAEAEARYTMSLVNQTADYWVISVVPKERIDRESFSKAFLKLNRKTFLPDEIFLVSPDDTSTKRFYLEKVRPNAKVNGENFKGKVLGPPWVVVRNPAAGDDAAAGGQRAVAPARGGPANAGTGAAATGAVPPSAGRRTR